MYLKCDTRWNGNCIKVYLSLYKYVIQYVYQHPAIPYQKQLNYEIT